MQSTKARAADGPLSRLELHHLNVNDLTLRPGPTIGLGFTETRENKRTDSGGRRRHAADPRTAARR